MALRRSMEKTLKVTASELKAFFKSRNVEGEGSRTIVKTEAGVEVEQPIVASKKVSVKRKSAKLGVGRDEVVDLTESKGAGGKVDKDETMAGGSSIFGFIGGRDATSVWSEKFLFGAIANEHFGDASDSKVIHKLGYVSVAQYMEVVGAQLLSIGWTQRIKHAKEVFDKQCLEQMMRENLEKDKKLKGLEKEIENLRSKVEGLEGEKGMLGKDKGLLQAKVVEVTAEKKRLEDDKCDFEKVKGNHGLEMFTIDFERAIEQVKFLASEVDVAAVNPCKVVVNGVLVDDDQDQEGGGENVAPQLVKIVCMAFLLNFLVGL